MNGSETLPTNICFNIITSVQEKYEQCSKIIYKIITVPFGKTSETLYNYLNLGRFCKGLVVFKYLPTDNLFSYCGFLRYEK